MAVLLFVLVFAPALHADEAQRRFLLIYSGHSTLAANAEATAGATATFDAALGAGYEIYAEYRDDQRFPGPDADRAFAEEMRRKYRGQRFDAVLVFGRWALDHALAQRSVLGVAAPIVFGGVSTGSLAGVVLPADVHGVASDYSILRTLHLARRLQPDARRLVVMTGSGPFDQAWRQQAERDLAAVEGLEVQFVSGLTLDGFRAVASGLGADTILLILTIYRDATGRQFTPLNAAGMIAEASGAPSWSVYDTYVGRGVVGGDVQRFRDVGASMAAQALRLARHATDVEPMREVPARPLIDWRQLRRFDLDPRRLPAGTELVFYDPPVWERYRWQVLGVAAVILALSATIAALVVQDRRRRAVERELAARRIELSRMSRFAQLGELSGALAHELNQPLTSILANAEAGAQLATRDPVDIDEIVAILTDIAEDDRRAAGIIVELRRLMAKGETEFARLDLDTVVRDVIRLSQSEFVVRQVTVETRLDGEALEVRANRLQLKQVVLNLLLNAADAMMDQPPEARLVTISTGRREDGWRELAVRDRGPGLAAEVESDPFGPFVTTKPNGLGLGLSICRTIAHAHGGTLAFDRTVWRGARVILALPPP